MRYLNEPINQPWLAPLNDSPTGSNPHPPTDVHPVISIAQQADPFDALIAALDQSAANHQILLGVTPSGLNLSASRRNAAILGAPRGGKTLLASSTAAAWHGPLVTVTVKRTELASSIGHCRARIAGDEGRLLHCDFSGKPTVPGFAARGWTPITTDPDRAARVAEAMVQGVEMAASTGSNNIWTVLGAQYLAPMILAAGVAEWPIEELCTRVGRGTKAVIEDAASILMGGDLPGHKESAETLLAILEMPPDTRGSVVATAVAALAAYRSTPARQVTKLPPIDWAEVVDGGLHDSNPYLPGLGYGCFSTVLFTGSSDDQKRLAPLIVASLAELERECFARYETDLENHIEDRRATLVMLDDMPTLAPMPDLPRTAAQSGGQNLIYLGIYHDDAQLRARWGDDGSNLTTSFGEQVVFRSISDDATTNRISTRTGQQFVSIRTNSASSGTSGGLIFGTGSSQRGSSTTPTLLPRLTQAQITDGHPDDPNIVLSLHPSGWEWIWTTPFYEFPMWVRAYVANLSLAGDLPPQRRHLLPVPELTRRRDLSRMLAAGGGELVGQHRQALRVLEQRRQEYQAILTSWATHPAMGTYDDSKPPDLATPADFWLTLTDTTASLDALHQMSGQLFDDASFVSTLLATSETSVGAAGVEPLRVSMWAPKDVPAGIDIEALRLVAADDDTDDFLVLRFQPQDRPGVHLVRAALGDLATCHLGGTWWSTDDGVVRQLGEPTDDDEAATGRGAA